MRVEPPARATRLSGDTRPAIISLNSEEQPLVLLPDGRLSCVRELERRVAPAMRDDSNCKSCTETIWRALEKPSADFIGGSNWVQAARTLSEVVGIKADGTLWSAPWYELVDATGNVRPSKTGVEAQKGERRREVELRFERVGEENDWKAISASWNYCIALKQNGTIWGWGDNYEGQLGDGPKVLTNGPVRIGAQADWVAVCAGLFASITRKSSRRGLAVGGSRFSYSGSGPWRLNCKVSKMRPSERDGFDMILDTDGFLWDGVPSLRPGSAVDARKPEDFTTPVRLPGENWSAFSMSWDQLAAIKEDGSLWRLPFRTHDSSIASRPIRLGHLKGLDCDLPRAGFVIPRWQEMATLCRFDEPKSDWRQKLLAPTRRITWSVNVLDGQE